MSYQNQSDSNHFSKIIELKFEIGGFHQGHDRLILKIFQFFSVKYFNSVVSFLKIDKIVTRVSVAVSWVLY